MKNGLIALDMGSSNTYIYQSGMGIILEEPSVVALDTEKGKVKALGVEAKKLMGLAVEETEVISPIFEGTIENELATKKMLKGFLDKINYKMQKMVVSVPCGVENEKLIMLNKVLGYVGCGEVSFVESPILTALGMGILTDSAPRFVINIGGGTTNISAVSSSGIIAGVNINFGGQNIDSMLISTIEQRFNLKIGMRTAEQLKVHLASMFPGDRLSYVVNGRDLNNGMPKPISVKAGEIYQTLVAFFDIICNVTTKLMAKLPPEVLAEINRSGIFVSGGVSKIAGLGDYLTERLQIKTIIDSSPEYSNVLGAGVLLSNKEMLKKLRINKR